ncbi:MAG: hypothetical protein J5J06_10970 [Phycisphaerae bacterium]|nr:hypothetical protein [Phycisphaerae bacterium]
MNRSHRDILRGSAAIPAVGVMIAVLCPGCRTVDRTPGSIASPAQPSLHALGNMDGGVTSTLTEGAPKLIRSEHVIEEEIDRETEERRNKEAQNPDGLARERLMRRLDENGEIPPNALVKAKRAAERMPELPVREGPLADAGIWSWEWLGPGNIGGRIRTMVIDPQDPRTMLIGSVAGGIWRTVNGGASWSPINDFLPSLSVTTLAMDPGNSKIIYAGTGESFSSDGVPGAGVFKSTDGGLSWKQLSATAPTTNPTTDPWGYVNRVAVSPSDGDIILAATNSGIWRSDDGGVGWQQVTVERTTDVEFRPSSSTKDVVAGLTDGTVMFSDDLGETWNFSDFNGALFSTIVSTAFQADTDSPPANDTLLVSSTAGFAVGDVIHVGMPSAAERAIVRSVVDGGTITVSDLQMNHAAGALVRIPADITRDALAQATATDGDNAPDLITVGSTAAFELGDAIRVGDGLSTESAFVVSVVDATTLTVTDLTNAHNVGELVRTRRSGRMELAWGSGCTVYASANIGGGAIYKSTDCGRSFSSLAGTDTMPNYLCSNILGIDDPNSCQGEYDNTIWVAPNDNDTIVVGGIDLWREPDTSNGIFLEKISNWLTYHLGLSAHADQHFIMSHPGYDGASNKTVYVCNDGGIQRTDDILSPFLGDLGWTNLANNLGITQFYGGAAAPDGSVIVGGAQDNDTLRYTPAGGTGSWFQAETGDGGFAAVDFSNPNVIYSEYVRLAIEKSTNGGNNYGPAINGLTDAGANALFIAPFVMDPSNSKILIAGGASIWRTTDTANNWSAIRGPVSVTPPAATPLCSAIDVAPTDSGRIWAGYTDGTISRTTTSVTNWTNVGNNGSVSPPNTFVTDIAINPNNASEVFVTLGGYATGRVWYTKNDGTSWEDRSGTGDTALPPVQVNTVRFHPADPTWVYVGTDLGVFASEDKGQTWSRTPRYGTVGHEGPANMEVSELFWQGGTHLIAATHGRGMYRTQPFSTVYVDQAYGGPEEGTLSRPFDTIEEGINAAGHGTTISIRAGDYSAGTTVFYKRGRITARGGVVRID